MKGMGKYESFNITASSGLSMSYYLTANLSGEGVVRVIQQNNLTGGKYESHNLMGLRILRRTVLVHWEPELVHALNFFH